MTRAEQLKKRLLADETVLGCNVVMTEPAVSDLLGKAGCEFVWIDMEHGAIDYKDAMYHVIAAHAGGAAAIIRVPGNDPDMMKKVLDMGADGIIYPLIRSAEEARQIIASCLYPPEGFRGFNPLGAANYGAVSQADYCANSKNSTLRIIMMEHIDAYRQLDEILAIPGLDGVMIGPSDLSGSMGKLLQRDDPEVAAIIEDTVKKCRAAGKFVGTALGCTVDPEAFVRWQKVGIRMFSAGQELDFLYSSVSRHLAGIRERLS